MSMDRYLLARPLLFRLAPEEAHNLTLWLAKKFPQLAHPWQRAADPRLQVRVGQTLWKTPIGLAAGLDKNAQAVDFFARLGFGSMEVGTVTLAPQAGNPLPRLFRYPLENSLRNSMGFPNLGMENCSRNLAQRPTNFPVAINIGKSKDANPLKAIDEYVQLYSELAHRCDWVVVNISSPNTPGLRDLQTESWLKDLLMALRPLRLKLQRGLFIKLSPDIEDEVLTRLVTFLADQGVDGIVATNTTHIPERGPGGVSGRLLRVKAHQKRKIILQAASTYRLPVIGVGGIESISDVQAYWAMGGEAFQFYTAFVYQGPALLLELEQHMLSFLNKAKLPTLSDFFTLPLKDRQSLIATFGA